MRTLVACVVVLSLLAGTIATGQFSSAQAPQRGPETGVWQYKVVHAKDLLGDVRDLEKAGMALEKSLNDLGGKGWEICQEFNGAVVFKRKQ